MLVRAFDDPTARFAAAWCECEQGRLDSGLAQIRQLFQRVAGPLDFGPRVPWHLWAFRQRFGATKLVEWGIHDELIGQLWLDLGDLPLGPGPALTFAEQWVNPWLLAFMGGLSTSARPALPWQLGGSGALASEDAWGELTVWAKRTAAAHGLQERPTGSKGHSVVDQWLFSRLAVHESLRAGACGQLARELSVLVPAAKLGQLAIEVDALLLRCDVRPRVPEAVRPRLRQVLFRVTPLRALDAAIVALDEGYGALVRHVVTDPKNGKQRPDFLWVEGTAQEVAAAMPERVFTSAVKALAGP